MVIDKFALYFAVLGLVSAVMLGPRLYELVAYKRTMGEKAGYVDQFVGSKTGGYTKHYPRIKFTTAERDYYFLAPSYMAEPYEGVENIEVIYDPAEPSSARAFNFYGFWGPVFIYYLPFFLVWTLFVLGVGFLPRKIKIG